MQLLFADAGKIDQQWRCAVKGRIGGSSNKWSEEERSLNKGHRLLWNYDHGWEQPAFDVVQPPAIV